MTKQTVTRIWIAGVIVFAAGLILGFTGLGLMLAYGGTFTQVASGSYNFVPRLDAFFWTMVGLMIVGFTVAAAGGIVQLAAWIGALVNTYRIEDKTWFLILLIGGLLSFAFGLLGFAAMVAYLVAGPDGMAVQQPQIPTLYAPRPGDMAPTS